MKRSASLRDDALKRCHHIVREAKTTRIEKSDKAIERAVSGAYLQGLCDGMFPRGWPEGGQVRTTTKGVE